MKNFGICLMVFLGIFAAVLMPDVQAQWFLMENPLLGKSAPEFSLQNLSAQKKGLAELRGEKGAILFFWATWCPHCRTQLALVNEKKQELAAKNITIILVDLGEPPQQVQQYVDVNGITFEVLLDQYGEAADLYSVAGIPTFVFVNAQGVVKAIEYELPSNYEELLK